MPEGDTVWLTAHRLDQALRDQRVTVFDLRVPKLALADLRGATVREVAARGKHILMRFDTDQTLHSHLKMDGSWRVRPAAQAVRPAFDVRAVVGTSRHVCLGRRVHDLALAPTAAESQWVGHLGPDLLGPDWDADEAVRRLAAQPERALVEALLDQRNLAGIGNLYANELCFLAGTHPQAQVAAVADLPRLVGRAKALLEANKERVEQATTGDLHRGAQNWVYRRERKTCLRCRTRIEVAMAGEAGRERATYWCPRCQPLS